MVSMNRGVLPSLVSMAALGCRDPASRLLGGGDEKSDQNAGRGAPLFLKYGEDTSDDRIASCHPTFLQA